jgi:16S rRNA (cytosine967-C5)-methyltransferase
MPSPARLAAFEILGAVNRGARDLSAALAAARRTLSDPRDQALAAEIATGALRWQGAIDFLLAHYARRPLARLDPPVRDLLRAGVYQLLFLDRVPPHAVVHDAVEMARRAGKRSAAGLVNAVLRAIEREKDRLPWPADPGLADDRSARLAFLSVARSHPAWLVERWMDREGYANAEAWTRFNNEPAPITLRVNTLAASVDEVRADLERLGVMVEPAQYAPTALVVRHGHPLATPLADTGRFFVQDEASQLVAAMAGARPGERVLDACASPGGKTTALAACMEDRGLLAAVDVRPRRVALLRQTVRASRAHVVRVVRADVRQPLPFAPGFDLALLDAPCSGLGTLRRDPDIRWRRTAEQLAPMAESQFAMLGQVAAGVRPGGLCHLLERAGGERPGRGPVSRGPPGLCGRGSPAARPADSSGRGRGAGPRRTPPNAPMAARS